MLHASYQQVNGALQSRRQREHEPAENKTTKTIHAQTKNDSLSLRWFPRRPPLEWISRLAKKLSRGVVDGGGGVLIMAARGYVNDRRKFNLLSVTGGSAGVKNDGAFLFELLRTRSKETTQIRNGTLSCNPIRSA